MTNNFWPSLICHRFFFFNFFFNFKKFIYFNWRLIILQYCDGFLPYIDINQPCVHKCPPITPVSYLIYHSFNRFYLSLKFCFCFLTALQDLWDLSFLTRD